MTREAWVVIDLGFGDAGKGATVDYLVRRRNAGLVVRFNGGAQAGHNVVTGDGVHHTFSQFGSGTFVDRTQTLLGPRFILHPGAMIVEERALRDVGVRDAFERTCVDSRASVISPYQQAACRLRELMRGDAAHGTCGVGIGEAVRDVLEGHEDTIRVAELGDAGVKLRCQRQRIRDQLEPARRLDDKRAEAEWRVFDDSGVVERTVELWRSLISKIHVTETGETLAIVAESETVVFEGAQGILLDQDSGFHPHTTWSDCTPTGAEELLLETQAAVHRLGVIRSYMVRHGLGPFPTENLGLVKPQAEPHNDDVGWQGRFRAGALDLVLLRYSLAACGGVDGLAVNCLDQLGSDISVCDMYQIDGNVVRDIRRPSPGDLVALEKLGQRLNRAKPEIRNVAAQELVFEIESSLDVPVWLLGEGASAAHRWCTEKFPVSR